MYHILFINSSQVEEYNINTQNSVTSLYTNNERSGEKLRKKIPFTIISNIIYQLGIDLTNKAKALYSASLLQ